MERIPLLYDCLRNSSFVSSARLIAAHLIPIIVVDGMVSTSNQHEEGECHILRLGYGSLSSFQLTLTASVTLWAITETVMKYTITE